MRQKLLLILSLLASIAVVATASGLTWFMVTYPDVAPAKDLKIEVTLDRTIRGGYLAQHVAVCMDCHSDRDWTKYAGPIVENSEGRGGQLFGPEMGLPGKIYARNITPSGIGHYSDGELVRAITEGVRPNGDTLFPLMPYPVFSQLCEEDIYSLVAYVRGLPAIENQVAETEIDFPVNMLIRTVPQPAALKKDCPKPSDSVEYGKYLVTMASCSDCHSPSLEGKPIAGKEFSGGVEFNLPWGKVRTANLTPDETGLASWTREQFIDRFKVYSLEGAVRDVAPGEFNTPMPWTLYTGMTREDLGAIYDYLRTVKPVHNQVDRFEAPLAQN
jgi:mono/diheme cytochrome c family protein